MRAVVIPQFGIERLTLVNRAELTLGPGQVLVAVKAVSLNYRDLLVAKGQYNPRMPLPRVPCSDCAGEVLAVGDNVVSVNAGDRVCGTFFQDWTDGPLTEAAAKSALGGAIDGVLTERVVVTDHGVVRIPDHLTFEEAATLPCAAVTAWNALTTGSDPAGKTVLVQGSHPLQHGLIHLRPKRHIRCLQIAQHAIGDGRSCDKPPIRITREDARIIVIALFPVAVLKFRLRQLRNSTHLLPDARVRGEGQHFTEVEEDCTNLGHAVDCSCMLFR